MEWIANLKATFSSSGIQKEDILSASAFFIGLNILYTSCLWAGCYLSRPTHTLISRLPYPRIHSAFALGIKKAEGWRVLRKVPESKRGAITMSLGEMLAVKGLLGPVAFPVKVAIAVKCTMMVKGRGRSDPNSSRQESN